MSTENVYKVVGPPGCGKTYWVARQTDNAVKKYGASHVMVASLTRAAAKEASGRILPELIPEEETVNIGTIHKIIYHEFNKPMLVGPKHIDEWNEEYPTMRMSRNAITGDDVDRSILVKERGDKLLADTDLLRSRMVDVDHWSSTEQRFHQRWTDFKEQLEVYDFTDLIERAQRELFFAPGQPKVIFIDEAQDLSTAELHLVRRWSEHAESTVIVGDGDQALYGWRGSDPNILSDPIWKVLDKSYRVPAKPHAYAMSIIRRCQSRPDVNYDPTEKEGMLDHWDLNIKSPELIDEIIKSKDEGYRVMVLASCDYMLNNLIRGFRENGVPYGNRFSPRWNPLRPGRGVSGSDRIRALVTYNDRISGKDSRVPTPEEVKAFAPLLRSGPIKRGMKKLLMDLSDKNEAHDIRVTLEVAFEPEAYNIFRNGTIEELESLMTPGARSSISYPLNIVKNNGMWAIEEQPAVDIGTIHSVKGGEAEHVIVAPDLSSAGWNTYQERGWAGVDAVRRLFYVAATRTKHRLTMLAPFGPRRFEP